MRAVIEHKTSVSGRPSALTHREKIIRAMEENLLVEQVYEIGGVVDTITGIPEAADAILNLLRAAERLPDRDGGAE